jgi:hypothetical protein
MGIDLGFTEESLLKCKYALCRSYRKKLVGFYLDPEDENSELTEYRSREKYVDMFHLRQEEPTLYSSILDETRGDVNRQEWPWNKHWFGDFYADRKKARRLNPYIETKLGARVLFDKMPKELKEEWMQRVDGDSLISAWWELPVESHIRICSPCPIRPLDEVNCYLRFSNYPGMNGFRAGFLLTALYSTTLDEEKLRGAYFSFPHVQTSKGQLPADKIEELFRICEGTPVNRGGEPMFNMLVDVIEKVKPEDVQTDAEKITMVPAPFVDEFLSKYIYREEPYTQEEIAEVLPYFETLQEIADWAVFDTNVHPARANILSFKDRINRLVTALRIGQKYGIDPYVSY